MTDETLASGTPETTTEVITPAAPEADARAQKPDQPDDPTAAAEIETAEPESPKPPKKTANGRIAEKHAQMKAAEARERAALRERDMLRDQLAKMGETEPDTYDEQESRRVRSAVKTERLEQAEAAAERERANAVNARQSIFVDKLVDAQLRIPDLKEAVEVFATLPVSHGMADLIAESDHAADIAYYLGKNPQVARQIYNLPPTQQGALIARLEAQIAAPRSRPITNAPAPVPTISGSKAPAAKDPNSMSMSDYAKWYKTRRG